MKKKSLLAVKQKVRTRRLEEVFVLIVDSNYLELNLEGGAFDLPGHNMGVFFMHATNFLRITKREMCHDIIEGETRLKTIVQHAFETDMIQLKGEESVQ